MTIYVWQKLAEARRIVGAVASSEYAARENTGRFGDRRDGFWYPPAAAVDAAAHAALTATGLLWILREVETAPLEVRLTFALIHLESGEEIAWKVQWPLAPIDDYAGKPQAQAATITSATKHVLLDVLAIQVTPAGELERSKVVGESMPKGGEMPAWSSHEPTTPAFPPPAVQDAFITWRDRLWAARGGAKPTWDDATAAALGGKPRPTRTEGETQAVYQWLQEFAARGAP